MTNPIEQQLFLQWIEGNDEAGHALFAHFRPRLLAFFQRRAPHAAEDLTQRTLLACLNGKTRMGTHTPFRAYAFTTARRMFKAEYARRRKEPSEPEVDELPDAVPTAHPLDTSRLRDALDRLCERDRAILWHYYVEGRTGPELTRALSLAEPAVRSRVRRALAALRREYARPRTELGRRPPLGPRATPGLGWRRVSLRPS